MAITNRRSFVCGGDFNANSALWGSLREDPRGDDLIELLVFNQLFIFNADIRKHTFVKKERLGRESLPITL